MIRPAFGLLLFLTLASACGADEPAQPTPGEDAARPGTSSTGGRDAGGSTGGRADAGSADAGSKGGARTDAATGARSSDGGSKPGDTDPPELTTTDAGSPADRGDADVDNPTPTVPSLPPVQNTDGNGPFPTKQELQMGPSKTSGIFRPAELGKDGVKHPIFVWGCGGTATPASYADQLSRVASHGFVVVAEVAEIGDDGAPLKKSIDWIVAENDRVDSPFYQRLNVDKIALGGHSIGSVNSFYLATDPRLTTTLHVAGGSLDNVNDPFAPTTGMGGKKLVHPVAYICSASDVFGNVEKTEKDYGNTKAPTFMTTITGADHTGAPRAGLAAIIAWLRWHLGGETERRAQFLEADGTFTTGKFVSKNKNW